MDHHVWKALMHCLSFVPLFRAMKSCWSIRSRQRILWKRCLQTRPTHCPPKLPLRLGPISFSKCVQIVACNEERRRGRVSLRHLLLFLPEDLIVIPLLRCSYAIEGGVCFLVLCDANYPKILAFSFLLEVQRGFLEENTHNDIQSAIRPYSFLSFGLVILSWLPFCNSPERYLVLVQRQRCKRRRSATSTRGHFAPRTIWPSSPRSFRTWKSWKWRLSLEQITSLPCFKVPSLSVQLFSFLVLNSWVFCPDHSATPSFARHSSGPPPLSSSEQKAVKGNTALVVVSVAMAFVVVLRDLLPFVLWTKRTDSFNQLHVRLASLIFISILCCLAHGFIVFWFSSGQWRGPRPWWPSGDPAVRQPGSGTLSGLPAPPRLPVCPRVTLGEGSLVFVCGPHVYSPLLEGVCLGGRRRRAGPALCAGAQAAAKRASGRLHCAAPDPPTIALGFLQPPQWLMKKSKINYFKIRIKKKRNENPA